MTIMERLRALYSPVPAKPGPGREQLTAPEDQIARRLSKLTGQKRDDVFAEAHRKADRIVAEYELAEEQLRGGQR